MLFKAVYILCGLLIRCQVGGAASIPEVIEAPPCSDGEFRCKSGACAAGLSRCNGSTECSDGSDETFVLCRNEQCSEDQFRCAYGACVVGAACDAVQHCADNSDERLARCLSQQNRTTDCVNGQLLADADKCDGKVDCADASDETVARCGEVSCGNDTFRCAYGGCAYKYAKCNGVTNCADGSDESDELCGKTRAARIPRMVQFNPKPTEEPTTLRFQSTCELPPQPEHGSYVEFVNFEVTPEERKGITILEYTCSSRYQLIGLKYVLCSNGRWVDEFPHCKLTCKLVRNRRVKYSCPVGISTAEGYQNCGYLIPSGMAVKATCKSFYYYPKGELPLMNCMDGKWDFVATCIPECGRTIPKGMALMAGGGPAKQGELPWHAGIYNKKETPYQQICGGSIISSKVIITAAHCFWDTGVRQRPCRYAVAAGKLYRDWDDPRDEYVQRQNVIDIIMPPRFGGKPTSNQDDLALVVLYQGLQFVMFVRPVCLDFEPEFDTRQLQSGNVGKVAGWGYTSDKGDPSPFLKVAELPTVNIEQCLHEIPSSFIPYITSDKICAGFNNGTAVCHGDSGGGLAFPAVINDVTRYYLRALVSTSPSDGLNQCNTLTITTFTHVLRHQDFIEGYFENFNLTGFQHFDARKVTFNNDTSPCF